MKWSKYFEIAFRYITAFIFIWAGFSKITHPCQLAFDIYSYHLVPSYMINVLAIVLPYIEIILGLCLIFGIALRGASLGIFLILLGFLAALSINFIKGISFSCGCFGSADTDLCIRFTEWYTSKNTGLTDIAKARLNTGCDIVRDIFFLIPATGAFILIQKRLKRR